MLVRTAFIVASVAAVGALPAGADAAPPKITRTCTPPRGTALTGGGLAYGAGGFWAAGQPSRYSRSASTKPTFVRVTSSCSVKSVAFPAKFRLTGALFAGLGGQVWGSGDDDGSTFEDIAISGTKRATVFPVSSDTNYLQSLAVAGGRALGSIEGGSLSWWTGPGSATEVTFPSAPAGGSSLAAASDRIWMAVDGSYDAANSIGYLANGAADVTVITAGITTGFSVNQVVVSGGTPWFTETDGSGNVNLGTVVGTSVVEYPVADTGGSGLVAAPGGGVFLINKAENKLLRFGAEGKPSGSVKGPSGYRLISDTVGGSSVGVLATQPNNGEGVGASKLLLVR